ncbi:MAG: MBL fold metallo-hydrolase [Microscillaceae bacterium]
MIVEQLYTGCLAEAAYFIVSKGEAAVIDPLRETAPYLALAIRYKAKIKYVFETHFHADFVSGHLDLAKATGATIVYGPTARPSFDAYIAQDQELFTLGDVRLKVIHTPGHTLESSCFLLIDKSGKDYAVFTGDTLFLGDVGRPDLAVKSDLSQEDLAGMLYDALRKRIMRLADEVLVYPGHGQGSACGKNMSAETVGTIGEQKRNNYALRPNMTREEFIEEITAGLLPPPQYFPKNALLNKVGYENIDEVMNRGLKALSVAEFSRLRDEGALMLDTRPPDEFASGFIPGSLHIGLDGMFAVWVGTLVENLHQPILLITPEGREEETVMRLARVGYDQTQGFLAGGLASWRIAGLPLDQIPNLKASTFAQQYNENVSILDVRRPGEFETVHVQGATNYPLDYLLAHLDELDKKQLYYVQCAGGYRSMIAASLLKRQGFAQIFNLSGGIQALHNTPVPMVQAMLA